MRSLKRRLALVSAAALAFAAAPAHADPISAAIVTAIGLSGTVAAVATFALDVAITFGASLISSALFGPKVAASAGQDRQADVVSLSIGEVPREVIFGRTAPAGSLIDCCYYGGQYGTNRNLFAIAIADHECDAIEGFYVNDTYVAWPFGAGQSGGVVPGYNNQLYINWRPGRADDPGHPDEFIANLPCLGQGKLKGVAHLSVAYDADAPDAANPVWSGRPSFLFVIRGKKVYDPRLDSTVTGGSGPQRWADPTTWTWSRNAALCEYAYQRGIYALDQVDQPGMLLVGRGLSDVEAPPSRVIAAANLCDEEVVHNVVDGATITEPRYAVDGVIKASDTFQAVAQMFADATAGVITQPEGGVFVEPGQAKTPVVTLTDGDLLIGQPVSESGFASDSDRINTVIARYIEPGQKYAETAAPVSRDLDDLAKDGGPRELTISLPLVTSATQAQRVADIRRKKARLERTFALVLGPRFAALEEGDWIGWTSVRYFAGATVYFRITAYGLDEAWRNTLALEEIDFDVYGFGGMGADPTAPEPTEAPDALALSGVQLHATHLEGDGGAIVPAVEGTWTTPVDPAIAAVRMEVRVGTDGAPTPTSTTNVNKGELITTAGVAPNVTNLQARLVPLGADPSRPITPSAWVTLTTTDLVSTDTTKVDGTSSADIKAMIAAALAAAAANLAAVTAVQAQADAVQATAHSELVSTAAGLQSQITVASAAVAAAGTDLAATRTTLQASIAATQADLTSSKATLQAAVIAAQADATRARSDLATASNTLGSAVAQAQSDATAALTNAAALVTPVASLQSSYGTLSASVSANYFTLTNADIALGGRIDVLRATSEGFAASLTNEGIARTNADSALATSITTLNATLATNPNVLANPSFALGFQGWNAAPAWTTAVYVGGSVAVLNTSHAQDVDILTVAAGITVAPGEPLALAGDVQLGSIAGGGGSGVFLQVNWFNQSDGGSLGTSAIAAWTTPGDWTRKGGYALAPTPTAGTLVVGKVILYGYSTSIYAFARRLKFEHGTIPTLYSDDASITGVNASVTTEVSARVMADAALASRITALTATVGGNTAAILSETTTRADADTALGGRIDSLIVTVGGNSAAILNESTARADAVSSLADQITSLTAVLDVRANLLTNSSFSAAALGWTIASGAGTGSSDYGPYVIRALASGDLGVASLQIASQTVAGVGPGSYALQAALYTGGIGYSNTLLRVVTLFLDSGGSIIGADALQRSTPSSWTVVKRDQDNGGVITAPSGTASILVVIDVTAAYGTVVGAGDNVAVTRIKLEKNTVCTAYNEETTASVAASIASEALTRAAADGALASRITTLNATVGGNTSAITSESTTRADADSALGIRIDTVTSTSGANTAAITSETTTRADADTALGARITTLTSTVDGVTGSVTSEIGTRAANDTALGLRIDTVTVTANAATGAITTETAARVAADTVLASQVTTLSATLATNPNLQINPTFAQGFTGWAAGPGWGTGVNVAGPQAVFSGAAPSPIVLDGVSSPVCGPGQAMTLSADAGIFAIASGASVTLQIVWIDNSSGAYITASAGSSWTAVGDWSRRSITDYAPAPLTPGGVLQGRSRVFVVGASLNISVRKVKLENGAVATLYQDDASLAPAVSGVTAAINTETSLRLGADTALATQITSLSATVGGNTSAISSEALTRSDADSALSRRIDTVTSASGANAVAISSETLTRSDADSALGGRIDALTATVGTNTAAITNEGIARATADIAAASQVAAITASLNGSPNLLQNPTFALGLQTWTGPAWSTATYAGGTVAVLNASHAQNVDILDSGTGVTVGAGEPLALSAEVEIDSLSGGAGSGVFAHIRWCNASNGVQIGEDGVASWTAVGGYVRRGGSATAPAPTAGTLVTAYARFYGYSTAISALLRRAKLERGTTPSQYADDATLPVVNAAVTTEAVARAAADAATAGTITTIQATRNSDYARVTTEIDTRVAADSALGSRIDTVSTTLGTLSAGVTATTTAFATLQGQVLGSYSLVVNANGNVAGLKLYALSGPVTTTGFLVEADQFVLRKAGSSVIPFLFDTATGFAYLQNVAIAGNLLVAGTVNGVALTDGTIGNPKIQPGAVTRTAYAENGGQVNVSGTQTSLIAAGLTSLGGTIEVIGSVAVTVNNSDGGGHYVRVVITRSDGASWNEPFLVPAAVNQPVTYQPGGGASAVPATVFVPTVITTTLSFPRQDRPAAGGWSYTVALQVDSGMTATVTFSSIALKSLEA